jgi:hypothetical protein
MKTTIDIPEKELQDAILHSGAKTKKDAVVQAVRDFNRRHRLAALSGMLGTFKDFMGLEDLKEMRQDRLWEKKK